MFDQLPNEINQEIGSYLDYDSRMNFGRVLPDVADRFVRKLNSDAHNLAYKRRLFYEKVRRALDYGPIGTKSVKQLHEMKQAILYFLHTKDEWIYLKNSMIERRHLVMSLSSPRVPQAYGWHWHQDPYSGYPSHRRLVRKIVGLADELYARLEEVPVNPNNIRAEFVLIE